VFISDSPDPDTLIVGSGAFLITTDNLVAVVLGNQGAWTVSVNGLISGGFGALTVNGTGSTVKIGATGTLSGGGFGLATSGTVSVKNAGVIEGTGATSDGISISFSEKQTIVNTGIITQTGGSGFGINSSFNSKDIIINSGTISSLFLGDGNDSVTNFQTVGLKVVSGHIATSLLGTGNDVFKGGKFAEDVSDGDGADRITLGSGNDTVRQINTNDGIDRLDGGKGVDTYSASDSPAALRINIDSVAHSVAVLGFAAVGANTATGATPGDQLDRITNFENVQGGTSNDLIYGSAAANKIEGLGGGDFLSGFGGNDIIDGGADVDFIFGGLGKDILTGGSEGDRFEYTSIKESGPTASTRDVITDFDISDDLNLTPVDAISINAKGTNDEFSFIGTNVDFSGAAGELRAIFTANGQRIEGDVNGDKRVDFSIDLQGFSHATDVAFTLLL
jgi:hypothetical protein